MRTVFFDLDGTLTDPRPGIARSIQHALAQLARPVPEEEVLLHRPAGSGRVLRVATSKPQVYASRIVEYFGLSTYFGEIFGSELSGERTDKGELLAYALNICAEGVRRVPGGSWSGSTNWKRCSKRSASSGWNCSGERASEHARHQGQ